MKTFINFKWLSVFFFLIFLLAFLLFIWFLLAYIKAFALDPLGLNVSNDKNAWFEIMQQLAVGFNLCLKP